MTYWTQRNYKNNGCWNQSQKIFPCPSYGVYFPKNKLSSKQMKKVNFEESEKDGPQVIEGGRVTASLVKVDQ